MSNPLPKELRHHIHKALPNELTLIIPVGYLADGEIITKVKGEAKYRIARTIKMRDDSNPVNSQEFRADEGSVFLIPAKGVDTITAVPDTLTVAWTTEQSNLKHILDFLEDYPHQ